MDTFDMAIDLDACRESFQARQRELFEDMETRRTAARSAILKAIQKILPSHPEIKRIYVFGSVNKAGAFHLDSDIDVAVEGTNAEEYFTLWHELSEMTLDWEIDLREINYPSYFSDSVQKRGELVYERKNPGVVG